MNNVNNVREIEALIDMKHALENLRKAWLECEYAFDSAYIDCNDYILGNEEDYDEYPFHLSFDEVNVVGWIDGVHERIEEKLNKIETS